MDIGKKLKNMRLDANDGLNEMAKKVEISAPVLSRMENGDTRVSDRVIYAYCKNYMKDFIAFMKECDRDIQVVSSVDGSKKYVALSANKGGIMYAEVK